MQEPDVAVAGADDAARESVAALCRAGVGRGDLVALVVAAGVGVGLAAPGLPTSLGYEAANPARVVVAVERALRPRWVVWSTETATTLVAAGVRIATCWDVAAVHRLLFGGWRADPALAWACLHDLAVEGIPSAGPPDLFSGADDDPDVAVGASGYLAPAWVVGGWAATPERLGWWAALALDAAGLQQARLADLVDHPLAMATARSESATELLCAELSADGLPVDRAAAEALIASFIGPRPADDVEAAQQRARRDADVLRHVPPGAGVDLRSPGQVRSLLDHVGVDVPDTRAASLEARLDAHPIVAALLAWRKAERIATTYGYTWLDQTVGADGRLHGSWSGADGGAGRMTASAGLHNMPADMRAAVTAEPGRTFVRADLGQIEPRVLAAVSTDAALAAATAADDLYAPVAAQLGVDRATAKVAVLGAMSGQTAGHGAAAMRQLRAAYPVAVAYLEEADRAARAGRGLRTYGGRWIPMSAGSPDGGPEASGRVAARGRYGRNAMVQGAAAELFKRWAVTVRARVGGLGGHIVLCLHDELLVDVPAERGEQAACLVEDCLQEAAQRWRGDSAVRFVADVSVIRRWSDAKG